MIQISAYKHLLAALVIAAAMLQSCSPPDAGTVRIPLDDVMVNADNTVDLPAEYIGQHLDGRIVIPRDFILSYRDTIIRIYQETKIQVPIKKGSDKLKDTIIKVTRDTLVRTPERKPIAGVRKISVPPTYASVRPDGSGIVAAELALVRGNEVVIFNNPAIKQSYLVRKRMVSILFVVIFLVLAGIVGMILYRIPMRAWNAGIEAGNPLLPLKMNKAGITRKSVSEVLYILRVSKKHDLGITLYDISHNQNIETEKYLEILRTSKEENLGITQEELQEHFSSQVDVSRQLHLLKMAKDRNVQLSPRDLKELNAKRVPVISYISSVQKSQVAELGVSQEEIKEMYLQKMDVDEYLNTLIISKAEGLNMTAPVVKEYFTAKVNLKKLTDIMSVAKEQGLELTLSDVSELPLTKVDADKLVKVLILSRNASLMEIKDMPLLANTDKDAIVRAFLVGGHTRLMSELIRQEASFMSRRELEKFAQMLVDAPNDGFKLSLENLREITFNYPEPEKLAKAFLLAKRNKLDATMRQMEEIATPKMEMEKLVLALIESKAKHKIELSIKELQEAQLTEAERTQLAETFIKSQENDISISMVELMNMQKSGVSIKKVVNALILTKKDPIEGLTSLQLQMLATAKVDVETLVKSLASAKQEGIIIPYQKLQKIKLHKLDIDKFISVYVLIQKNNLNISIAELAEHSSHVADTKKTIQALILLRNQGGEDISLTDLESYNNLAMDIEKLAEDLLALKKADNEISLRKLIVNKFVVEDVAESIENYKKSQNKELKASLKQITEHQMAGGSAYNLVKALDEARKLRVKVSLETLSAIDLAGLNPVEAVQQTSGQRSLVISPVVTTTKDGIQFILKIQLMIRLRIDRYMKGMSTQLIEAKVKELSLATIGQYVNRENVLERISVISEEITQRLKDNEELQSFTAYEILDFSILDTTTGIDTNLRLKVNEARDRKVIAESQAQALKAETFIRTKRAEQQNGQVVETTENEK